MKTIDEFEIIESDGTKHIDGDSFSNDDTDVWINRNKTRQSAIEDVKGFNNFIKNCTCDLFGSRKGRCKCMTCIKMKSTSHYIMEKFNLTEDDVK